MFQRIFPYFTLISVVFISTLILWLPFLLHLSSFFGINLNHADFHYIYKNFDGVLYIIAAKTWYTPKLIDSLHVGLNISPQYFAAHLPLYPFFIAIFSIVMGYLKSMIFVNLISTIILAIVFYEVLKRLHITSKPVILSIVFLFLPRFLVVRSIGAPESLFLLLMIGSIYFFEKKQLWLSGLLGALAVMTKSPGILLFVAYCGVFIEEFVKTKKFNWQWLAILLIPLGLLSVFYLYFVRTGDFLAYFHSGDNIHLVFPYSVFNYQKTWVGTAWLEEIIGYFFLYTFAVITLFQIKYRSFFYFSLIFLTATIFIQHRDISRYALPLWPFACIAFEKFFTSKKFMVAALIILPAIFLYAFNFLVYNVAPITEWKPFM